MDGCAGTWSFGCPPEDCVRAQNGDIFVRRAPLIDDTVVRRAPPSPTEYYLRPVEDYIFV
eukprot:4359898-Prymnesium_polylepis.1